MNSPLQGLLGGQLNKMLAGHMENWQKTMEELRAERVTASAGGGVVEATASGVGELLDVVIDPALVESGDVQMLQDLVVSAVREVLAKASETYRERLKASFGALGNLVDEHMPGLL
ncbi:MAG: YbaB/EbfC family nucleoid-associated protein [Armatimonadota bacterium]|jgi:DNA-binding YbaB/EbfC family protein